MRRTASLIITVCFAACFGVKSWAATPISLDGWLARDAAPKLARTLGQHPKFSGEVIRMSGMQDGHLTDATNQLVQEIERELTLQLNRYDNVRIRWNGSEARPSDAPVHYVLGIEVRRKGTHRHTVTLAIVDVSEGIWVSGTAHRGSGRLSRTQQTALEQSTPKHAPPGETLLPLTFAPTKATGVCKNKRESCVEVAVTLQQPAALAVLSSTRGRLNASCMPPSNRAAGTYRFRLPVPATDSARADAGVYAIATSEPALIDRLTRLLGTHGCNVSHPALGHMLDEFAGRYEWRALHLRHAGGALQPL